MPFGPGEKEGRETRAGAKKGFSKLISFFSSRRSSFLSLSLSLPASSFSIWKERRRGELSLGRRRRGPSLIIFVPPLLPSLLFFSSTFPSLSSLSPTQFPPSLLDSPRPSEGGRDGKRWSRKESLRRSKEEGEEEVGPSQLWDGRTDARAITMTSQVFFSRCQGRAALEAARKENSQIDTIRSYVRTKEETLIVF